MYLSLVLMVMIVTGSYILLSMQKTEIDKARTQLALYAEKVSEQVVESYYGYSGEKVKGIIFCSSIKETQELSDKFNNIVNPDTGKYFKRIL